MRLLTITFLWFLLLSNALWANPYLQSTDEIDLQSQELIALADSLDNDPVKIYNWVYNNIEFEAYQGARKNALSVYWTRQGNSWGQSTLLSALYRIIGIETRYVFPDETLLPASKIAEYQAKLNEEKSAGTLPQSYSLEAYISYFFTDSNTAYIEADLSLNQIRGFGGEEKKWIPLAPWVKKYINSAEGIDFFDDDGEFIYEEDMTFDLDEYVSKVRKETAWEMYKNELSKVLSDKNLSLKSASRKRYLLKRVGEVLPLSLPSSLINNNSYVSFSGVIPEEQKLKIAIFVTEIDSGTELLKYEFYLSQIATSRLVIDFVAPTNYNGIISDAANLTVNPVIKIDGEILKTGLPTNTNKQYQYSYHIEGSEREDRVPREVGTLDTLNFDNRNVSQDYLSQLKQELNNIPASQLNDWRTREEFLGRYLEILSNQYLLRDNVDGQQIREFLNLKQRASKNTYSSINMYSDMKASDLVDLTSLTGQAEKYLIHPVVNIDAVYFGPSDVNIFNNRALSSTNIFRLLRGYSNSFQEGLIFEDWQSTSAGSSIHALMYASESPNNSVVKTVGNGTTVLTTEKTVQYDGLSINATIIIDSDRQSYLYNSNNGGSSTAKVAVSSKDTKKAVVKVAENSNKEKKFVTVRQLFPTTSTSVIESTVNFTPNDLYSARVSPDGDPVDLYSGEFYQIESPDIQFKSYAALDFSIKRTYKSKSTYNGGFGYGWVWNHMDQLLIDNEQGVIFYFSNDGKSTKIDIMADNQYRLAPGITFSITQENDQYIITEKDGFKRFFDREGLLVEKRDIHHNSLYFTYDEKDNVTSISDNLSRSFTLRYNANDKVTSINSSSGQTVYYEYYNNGDDNGTADDLKAFTNLENNKTQYEYIVSSDGGFNNHNMKKYTLPESTLDHLEIHYYKNDQVSHHVNSQGDRFNFQYSVKNSYAETWNEIGYYRKVFFNDNADAIRIDSKDKNVETMVYDDNHNLLSRVDDNGNNTEYTYDDQRNILTITDALGHITTYTYTDHDTENNLLPLRQLASVTYANNDTETFTYYSTGLLKEKAETNGNILSYSYDAKGNMLSEVSNIGDANNYREIQYVYDNRGISLLSQTTDNKTTQYAYDNHDNVSHLTNPSGHQTQWLYDNLKQKIQETDAKGEITYYAYNKNQQLISTTLPNGGVYQNTYHPARDIVTKGLLKEKVDPYGHREHFTYDGVGNMLSHTDKNNHTRYYKYDENKRVLEKINAQGHSTYYKYDSLGNVLQERTTNLHGNEPIIRTTYYRYDKLSRVTRKGFYSSDLHFPENNYYINYAYDSVGRQTSARHYNYDFNTNGYAIALITEYEYQFSLRSKITTKSIYPKDGKLVIRQTRVTEYGYDKLNRKVSFTNENGVITQYRYYGGSNNIKDETTRFDTTEIVKGYTYTPNDLLATYTDPNGNVTSTQYNVLDQQIATTNALGDTTRYTYNTVGQLIQQTSPLGYTDHIEYDRLNREIKRTNKNGYSQRFTYDANSNLIRSRDENDFTTYYYYDELNQKIAQSDDNGRRTVYSYDDLGNVVSMTNPIGVTTDYQYDAASNPIEERYELSNGDIVSTQRTYDGLGRLTTLTDANGNTTTFIYGYFDQPYQITDAKGQVTTYAYTKLGDRSVVTKPDGTRDVNTYDDIGRLKTVYKDYDNQEGRSYAQYDYDNANNIIREVHRYNAEQYILTQKTYTALNQLSTTTINDATISLSYDADSRKVTSTDPRGYAQTYDYDGMGNVLSMTNTKGDSETYIYDKRNNQTGYLSAEGVSLVREYDAYNNIVRTLQDDRERHTEYDGINRVTREVDFTGNITRHTYDNSNNRLSTTTAYGTDQEATTRFVYDENTNIIQVHTPTASQPVTYTYNVLNQRISEITAENRTSHYTYDSQGNMLTHTQPDNTVIEYGYDALDRKVSTTVNGVLEQSFSYDRLSRLSHSVDYNGGRQSHTISYAYNDFSEIVSETQNDKHVATQYDVSQNDISINYNNRYVIEKTYDQINNLDSLTNQQRSLSRYVYNRDQQRLSQQLLNGITVDYSYDNSAREVSRRYGNLYRQQTVYDQQSNVIQENRTFANEQRISTYTYDANHRLTQESTNNNDHYFVYDLNGNITGTNQNGLAETRQLNSDDQYTGLFTDEPNVISYDDKGNISQYQGKGYQYDFANRLIQVIESGHTIATYTYDAENRRVSKTVNGTTTTYLYNKNQVVQEYIDTQTDPNISYIYSDKLDDPIAFVKDSDTYYYLKDRIGSIQAITDEKGSIVERYSYNAFGIMTITNASGTVISESAYDNKYTYTGRRFDNETGLYYYRNRMYSAELGRFLQEDPVGYEDGYNLYQYAHNNPLKYVDPLGTTARATQSTSIIDQLVDFARGVGVGLADAAMRSNFNEPVVSLANPFVPTITGVDQSLADITEQSTGSREFVSSLPEARSPADETGRQAAPIVAIVLPLITRNPATVSRTADNIADGLRSVPGRVQSRINLQSGGLKHTLSRHLNPASNGSQFSLSKDGLASLLQSKQVVSSPITQVLDSGNFLRVVNVGKNIGFDKFSGNKATSTLSVITDKFGNLVTATPGVIK